MNELETVLEDNARLRAMLKNSEDALSQQSEFIGSLQSELAESNSRLSVAMRRVGELESDNERLCASFAEERKAHKEATDARDVLAQRLVAVKDLDAIVTVGAVGLDNQYHYVDAGGMTNAALTAALLDAQKKIAMFELERKELASILDDKESALQMARSELDDESERRIVAAHAADFWHKRCLEARRMVAEAQKKHNIDFLPWFFDDDGFCNVAFRWCAECGGNVAFVRPGDARCQRCGK